jgi:hypothetical protein
MRALRRGAGNLPRRPGCRRLGILSIPGASIEPQQEGAVVLKRAISTLLAVSLLFGPARADLTTDLLALYSFNGHTNDISGNANHGSPMGGFGFTSDRFGNPNAAGEFNGFNSYVLVPNSANLASPDSACTQAAWILLYGPSQVGTGFGPITMKSASTENAFMYRLLASQAGFGSAFNNWFTHTSTPRTLNLDQWYHVATVFDGSTVQYFLDGAAIDTLPMALTITPDTRSLTIGADIPGILEIFNGRIDDVRIYSRALSHDDIAEMYGGLVGIEGLAASTGLTLAAIRPNPTSGTTDLEFTLGTSRAVHLSIHDVHGRRVRNLSSGRLPAGRHAVRWDGRDAHQQVTPAGLYFVRLVAGSDVLSRRIVRIP